MRDLLKSVLQKGWVHSAFKAMLLVSVGAAFCYVGSALAADATGGTGVGIGRIAENVRATFGDIAKLITAAAYVGGMGFAVAAILKFKAHKDNPNQIPLGTPIALLFISASLIFLPALFKAAGETIFGSGAKTAGVEGATTFDWGS